MHANYTYSKVLTDSAGNVGTDFEPLLDNHNPRIERSQGAFLDLTHVFKATGSYDLPLGRLAVSRTPVGRIVLDGWNVAGIFNTQTGQPFSITAGGRGTLNRASGRSQYNTANTTLNKAQLDNLIQFRMTAAGPYFIAASAIGPDGRGVAADGAEPFAGQVFFNPAPAARVRSREIGSLVLPFGLSTQRSLRLRGSARDSRSSFAWSLRTYSTTRIFLSSTRTSIRQRSAK